MKKLRYTFIMKKKKINVINDKLRKYLHWKKGSSFELPLSVCKVKKSESTKRFVFFFCQVNINGNLEDVLFPFDADSLEPRFSIISPPTAITWVLFLEPPTCKDRSQQQVCPRINMQLRNFKLKRAQKGHYMLGGGGVSAG